MFSSRLAPIPRKISPPKPETPDLISSLPAELRNPIYECTIAAAVFDTAHGADRLNAWYELPLLQTCKQIRKDASPMWYKAQSFCMYAGEEPDKVAIYVGKLRSVIDRCGPNPFKKFYFCIPAQYSLWPKLDEILPFLDFIRETGFEPATEEYKPNLSVRGQDRKAVNYSSVFSMPSANHATLQRVLEDAVTLGRKARHEDWSEEKLAAQFAAWKKIQQSRRGRAPKGRTKRKAL